MKGMGAIVLCFQLSANLPRLTSTERGVEGDYVDDVPRKLSPVCRPPQTETFRNLSPISMAKNPRNCLFMLVLSGITCCYTRLKIRCVRFGPPLFHPQK